MAKLSVSVAGPISERGRRLLARYAKQLKETESIPDGDQREDVLRALERAADALDGVIGRGSSKLPPDVHICRITW